MFNRTFALKLHKIEWQCSLCLFVRVIHLNLLFVVERMSDVGKIPGYFTSEFSTFCLASQNVFNSDMKNSGFVSFGANLTHFGSKSVHTGLVTGYWISCLPSPGEISVRHRPSADNTSCHRAGRFGHKVGQNSIKRDFLKMISVHIGSVKPEFRMSRICPLW